MSSLITYNGLQVLTPEPSAAGGKAISDNFKALSTPLQGTDPGSSDDSSLYYSEGSRWFNSATGVEWVCTDASVGAALWQHAALWDSDGSDVYYIGGNVGIGTSTPGGVLEVTATSGYTLVLNTSANVRQIALRSSVTDNAIQWDSSAHGTSHIFSVGLDVGGATGFAIYDENNAAYALFIDNSGSVGIGTAAPGSELDVNGKATADSFVLRPQSSAPSGPSAGQIYYDSAAAHFYGWNGTAWKQLDN